jgi:elongation factor Ts
LQFGVDQVKALREQTGAGVMDCRRALEESQGDLEKAEKLLSQWGMLKAEKRIGAETLEGAIESYVHSGGRIAAMVELNCQTDFVARTDGFKELAHNLAMQVAAMAPEVLDVSDLPEGDLRNPEEACLLKQPFIKDNSKIIQDLITELAVKVGENIRVRRFVYFALGR